MPRRTVKRTVKRKSKRTQRGRGLMDVLKKLHQYAKDKRVVSGALRSLGHTKLANATHALGYGRKKRRTVRRRRTMRGSGFFGDLWSGIKKGFNYVKDNKLLSKGLALIPHPGAQKLAGVAGAVGLGRRRVRRTTRSMSGGSSIRY